PRTHGCLKINASLVPVWRGAAPIHRAIMAGDTETGICIMQMDAGLDTGPVLLRDVMPIEPTDTTGDLHDRLSLMGAKAIVAALDGLPALTPIAQPEDGVTYAEKIDKAEAQIDWSQEAETIDRQIRGLSPFPGAWTTAQGERVKLLGSTVSKGAGPAGAVLPDFTIACGSGAVQITRAQRAGKQAQDAEIFLRGKPLPPVLGR
ncbi:methionyl-tRNA formyltransferase, partial [Nereida sp. MMG025]|uniref:methionyl-tRNA formyltransferase n=1 Tax=Nereida sp. MMG025 TaxID=2909981 RepID=UPI00272E3D1B